MKKLSLVVALIGVLAIASCSSSGGGSSSPQDAVNNSATAFGDVLASIMDNPNACTVKATLDCSCPTSGSLDWDTDTNVFTMASCVGSGMTYTGTIDASDDGNTITADMSQFGQCTNVEGTITGINDENCSGQLTGTCAGQTVTCTMQADCDTCAI